MKCIENWVKGLALFVGATLVCGALYTAVVTLVAQVAFPYQANGSFVEGSDGNRYSMLVGQSYSDEGHMWGRVQNYNAETFVGEDGFHPTVGRSIQHQSCKRGLRVVRCRARS